jgi:hypothetical protein
MKSLKTPAVFALYGLFLAAAVWAGPRLNKANGSMLVSGMLKALGGEKFLELSSLRILAHGQLPRQTAVRVDFVQRGEKLRSQIETSFWVSTEVFDGESGWRRFGREKAFKLAQSPLALFSRNGLERIRRLESDSTVLGPDTLIEKTNCRWLKTFDAENGELWIFVDAQTSRPKELFSPANGMKAALAAYQNVGGVWFPHLVTVRQGSVNLLELTLDTVEINPELSDSLFLFPSE